MARKGHLNRNVTIKEYPWLEKDLKKRKVVYKYYGFTYGCISSQGVAVTDKPDKTPFYELPQSAINWD